MTFLSTEPKFSDSDNVLLAKILQQLITNPGGPGGGSQTPWTANINGGGFNLSNVGTVTATNFVGNFVGAQTPWTSDIDGAQNDLNNVNTGVFVAVGTKSLAIVSPDDTVLVRFESISGELKMFDISDILQLTFSGSEWTFEGNVNAPNLTIAGQTLSATLRTAQTTVAALPAAATAGAGARAFVTNAAGPAFGVAVVGGGGVQVPVYSDGTNWIVG